MRVREKLPGKYSYPSIRYLLKAKKNKNDRDSSSKIVKKVYEKGFSGFEKRRTITFIQCHSVGILNMQSFLDKCQKKSDMV